MSILLQEYLRLKQDLLEIRIFNPIGTQPFESEFIFKKMDTIWWQMTDEDRKIVYESV